VKRLSAVALAVALFLGGCASTASSAVAPALGSAGQPAPVDTPSAAAATPSLARLAKPARSQRIRFAPERVTLPDGAAASVVPADTVDGVLQVPKDVRRVGWWTGSAYVGDPFGATVIAGHVDSAEQGIGFFAKLLTIRKGARLAVSGDARTQTYRVKSVRLVGKNALVDDGAALDQTGPQRLVLITCAGQYRPAAGGYESNLVVVAEPIGSVR
jgi:LPXTG-site transpeptidase (sortase) family protein